jgi:hypothetical protein
MTQKLSFQDRIDAAVTEAIKEGNKQLKELAELNEKVYRQIEEVVDLAETAYNEGDDYYGADYLSQRLDWDKKKMLGILIDNDLPFEDMVIELRQLSGLLKKFASDLREEIKQPH